MFIFGALWGVFVGMIIQSNRDHKDASMIIIEWDKPYICEWFIFEFVPHNYFK